MEANQLKRYVKAQLLHFFPDGIQWDENYFDKSFQRTMERVEHCFSNIRFSSFRTFNHLHTDQYAMFLYLFSNTVWKECGDVALASKLMYLNKALHSLNCMYDTELPKVFCFIHINGAVLGKATYGNYFTAYQGVTVGSHGGKSPVLGDCVSLLPHSSVVGECHIGEGVAVGNGSRVYQMDVPSHHSVIQKSGEGLKVIPAKGLYSDIIFTR